MDGLRMLASGVMDHCCVNSVYTLQTRVLSSWRQKVGSVGLNQQVEWRMSGVRQIAASSRNQQPGQQHRNKKQAFRFNSASMLTLRQVVILLTTNPTFV